MSTVLLLSICANSCCDSDVASLWGVSAPAAVSSSLSALSSAFATISWMSSSSVPTDATSFTVSDAKNPCASNELSKSWDSSPKSTTSTPSTVVTIILFNWEFPLSPTTTSPSCISSPFDNSFSEPSGLLT